MKLKQLLMGVVLGFSSMMGVAYAVVDVNTASAQEMSQELKGIGPVKAQAIVVYREKNGPFKTMTDLEAVPGIGEHTIARNAELIDLPADATTTAAE